MTLNTNEITSGYIICWTNALIDNIIKINMSQTVPIHNYREEFEYLDDGVRSNDVMVLCKRIAYPVSKLQRLYVLLDEYRVSITPPLFDCNLEFVLDVINRMIY